ncbi:MAG TPA: AMMECR1 domain-containing protein [Candidatus Paceibacterota bacterium]|nr:AMMECR1 domain-containing protein [Candidatus Paceibacterota bacterium]
MAEYTSAIFLAERLKLWYTMPTMSVIAALRGTRVSVVTAAILLVTALCFGLFFIQEYRRVLTLERLTRAYVPGVHGVVLMSPHASSVQFEPWHPLEQNRSLETMLARLCSKAGLVETCATDPEIRFELFTKGQHVVYNGAVVELERGVLPLPEEVSRAFLEGRLRMIAQWVEENQRDDGSLPYLYSPSRGEYPEGSNVIRQMITVQGLYAVANILGDEKLRDAAVRAEGYMLRRSLRNDGNRAYMVEEDGEVKLGASALAVLALREKSGGESTAHERALGEFLLSMQRPDGSFQTFLQDEPTDENDRFYSGEALTALAKLAVATGEQKYYDALARSLPYYRAKLESDFYPQYAPWHMQAYAIAYQATDIEEYKAYTYWLADRLIETMLENDTDALPDEEGRFYNPDVPEWGPPHSSSTGIYTEGLTYAYEIARADGDVRRAQKYRDAVLQGTRSLLHVQWTPESAYYLTYPERVVGSFKRTVTDNRHRIDQMGHAANALARVYSVVLE